MKKGRDRVTKQLLKTQKTKPVPRRKQYNKTPKTPKKIKKLGRHTLTKLNPRTRRDPLSHDKPMEKMRLRNNFPELITFALRALKRIQDYSLELKGRHCVPRGAKPVPL